MIDYEFLEKKSDIKAVDVQKIQEEIMTSIKTKEFDEINGKYDEDVLLHLCHDLITQGKLVSVAKTAMTGIEFLVATSNNPEKESHL